MRDTEAIDSELRLVAAVRRVVREAGGPLPSIAPVDVLLDERQALQPVCGAPVRPAPGPR